MKMANIGIGAGAFADGLMGGLRLGRDIKRVRNENEIEAIRRDGLEKARQERERQIDQNIAVSGLDQEGAPEWDSSPLGLVGQGASRRYKVGDKEFRSKEEARGSASEGVEPVIDMFVRDVSPRIQEAYLAQGDIEKAESWSNWAKSRTGSNAIRDWATGYHAAQRGDWDRAASAFGKYYSNYIDGDMKYVGHDTLKDGEGNVTGFSVKLKDRKTGKETALPMGAEELLQLGMANNPQSLFDTVHQQQLAADNARLSDAQASRKYDREQSGRIELEAVRAQLRDQTDQRKFDRNINALKEAGYSDQFIRQALPSLLGVDASGPYKKGASPEEAARMLHQERMKDFRYQRMTPEEQDNVLAQDAQRLKNLADVLGKSSSRGANQTAPAGQAASQGVIFDTQTNQFIPIR